MTLRPEPVRGGLEAADLGQVAELEAECARHDGVRLKLEWGELRRRPVEHVNDWVCRDGDRVVGFCGLYSFQTGQYEVCGMVAPGFRRRGVARSLLDAMLEQARSRPSERLLLVVDRAGAAAGGFAAAVGATYEHSEYSMRLTERPTGRTRLTMRPADPADAPFVAACLGEAFGVGSDWTMPDPARRPITMFFEGSRPVATMHVAYENGVARLYGFVVPAELRGQGYGGQALRLIVGALLDDGHPAVELEVATANESALSLYRRSGFELVSTIDYHAVPL